jgi:L-alanine-DL-glutamate epimerase-like enolase superfamily enzyme
MSARSLEPYDLAWRQPPATASGVPASRQGWIVRLREGDHVGVGDAAPWESWGTESAAACEAALLRWRESGELPSTATPVARSAVATAQVSLDAARAGLPLAHFLAAQPLTRTLHCTSHLLGDSTHPATSLLQARRDGYTAIKFKCSPASMWALADAIDAAPRGDSPVALRLDFNRSCEPNRDGASLQQLIDRLQPELVEEPFDATGRAALLALANGLPGRIGFDESLSATSADELLAAAPAATFVLKPAILGGVAATFDLGLRLHAAGASLLVTNFLESAAGRLAARHLSAALEAVASARSGGHATGALLATDLFELPDAPRWQVPPHPGLHL